MKPFPKWLIRWASYRDLRKKLVLGDNGRIKAKYITRIRKKFPEACSRRDAFWLQSPRDAEAESDIDLLVLVDVETIQFRSTLWRIASDVSLDSNVVLSPQVLGRARWGEIRRIRLPLYRATVVDGIPLTAEVVPT